MALGDPSDLTVSYEGKYTMPEREREREKERQTDRQTFIKTLSSEEADLKSPLLRHVYYTKLKTIKSLTSHSHVCRRQIGNYRFVLLKNVPQRN